MVGWGVWFIVIYLLTMGSLRGELIRFIHKRLCRNQTRVRSPKKVVFRYPAQEPSPLPKKSQTLADDPLYQKIVQKLQALDYEIGTLPPHSVKRRVLEGQRWVYAIVCTTAQLAYQVRTKPDPSNSSSNHQ